MSGATRIEAYERLNDAAAALLDPLLDPALEDDAPALARRLGEAIGECARVADGLGLRGLNYLATLLVPYLRAQAAAPSWPALRGPLEGWVGQVVAFCAGHLGEAQAPQLMLGLLDWPEFPAIPPQFVSLISGRLRQDTALVRTLVEASASAHVEAAGQPAPVAAAAATPPPDRAPQDARERRAVTVAAGSFEVARDELDMLAEAVEALDAELFGALGGDDERERRFEEPTGAATAEFCDLCAERLGNLANAIQFVGLTPLGELLSVAVEALHRWRDRRVRFDAAAPRHVRALLERLAAYLRDPSEAAAAALASGLADDTWPLALAREAVEPLAAALGRVSLLQSRQVQGAEAVGVDDLSLAIPRDADRQVVDHLLRELPPMAEQFAQAVDAVTAGSTADIAAAQRIAHTLKGAANTVGIRGIATLTHRLEDLLQLLERAGGLPSAAIGAQLASAADCLGEMADAVVRGAPAPAEAREVCDALGVTINGLLLGTGEPSAAPGPGAAPEAPASPAAAPAAAAAGPPPAPTEEEVLRVPARLADRMLDLAGETAILIGQVQEQLALLAETRAAFGEGGEQLQRLASELERLVDVRGVTLTGRRQRGGFDALELDEFDEMHMLSRRIAESGADGKLLEQQLQRQSLAMEEAVGQLERVQAELREAVMQSRLVTVATIAPRLQRAVRQAARMSGRQARLLIHGAETTIDAQLLQALVDPLAHLLRNAVDHGIEDEAARAAAGKPAAGVIELHFARSGRRLQIRCADDGAGLDEASIRARAIELGLLSADAQPERAELLHLIVHPGFSTRRAATQLSGRGIGLDVVDRAVRGLRGTLEIASSPGRGTTFAMEIPERLVAVPVTIARAAGHLLALSVRGVLRVVPSAGVRADDRGVQVLDADEGAIPVVRLDEALGVAGGPPPDAAAEAALVVRSDDGATFAVIASALSQSRNVVVRPLPSWLPRLPALEGAAVLGDGSVAAVLDLPRLLAAPAPAVVPVQVPSAPAPRGPRCLVVDDSVSVRRAMATFVHDLGLEVDAAGDGLEALERVDEHLPDLAIVDLEMPRMNGLELAAALRSDTRTRGIPIIMITSRHSERHRALAQEAGVDAFLTKPYTEDELAARIRDCLVGRPAVG